MSDWQARSGAVIWRETTRASRRWQTYAARSGFSALLLGVLVLGVWSMTYLASFDLLGDSLGPHLGRALFVTFTVIQMLIGLVMAPIVTARAVIEERLEGTLDLMVLTPVSTRALLLGKVASRLMVLGLIVLGSMPLLALAVTLGGVAVTEVVLATLGNGVSLVVMGMLGAFFGLFTRSPILALLATLGWATLAFVGLPGVFALLVASPSAMAHFSPLFASTGTWSGLVLAVAWVPTIALTALLASRMFELRASRVALTRYFEWSNWYGGQAAVVGVALLVASLTILPLGMVLSWANLGNQTSLLQSIGWWSGWGLSFVWVQLLVLLCTWGYLRIGMDLVDALDGMLGGVGLRSRRKRGIKIWRNPVAWRESRVSGWGRGVMPLLVIWGIVLITILQTFLWLFPGGVLALGVINGGLTLLLTVWGAVSSIEQERKGRSLDLLRVSGLTPHQILKGKLGGVATPSLPMLLLTCLFVIVGLPHAGLWVIFDQPTVVFTLFLRSLLTSAWVIAFWAVLALSSMLLALRLKTPATAYMVMGASVGAYLLIPAFLSWTLRVLSWWLTVPFRILVPPLVPGSAYWEHVGGTLLLIVASLVLYRSLYRALDHFGENA